ncbi:MAG: hypothetical protein ACTSUT_19205 [Promethearchaeota archaeon]
MSESLGFIYGRYPRGLADSSGDLVLLSSNGFTGSQKEQASC